MRKFQSQIRQHHAFSEPGLLDAELDLMMNQDLDGAQYMQSLPLDPSLLSFFPQEDSLK